MRRPSPASLESLLRAAAACAAAVAAGCGSSAGSPDPMPPVRGIESSSNIAGTEVRTERQGAWEFRRAGATPATKDDHDGRREEKLAGARTKAFPAEAGMPGAAPPAGDPVPRLGDRGDGGGAPAAPSSPPAPAKAPGARPAPASGGESGRLILGDVVERSLPLRAGSTDDNEDFGAFLEFTTKWAARNDVAANSRPIDVRDRKFVRVMDSRGRPVPLARVTVLDETADRLLADATTYGDGRIAVYPHVAGEGPMQHDIVIDVRRGAASARLRARLDGTSDIVVSLASDVPPPDPVPIDVAFLIDTTGSMGDEIASIQDCLLRVTAKIRGLAQETDLRAGAVLYRDVGDEYLTAKHPLTADVGVLDAALREVRADGGGDGPESLNQGLAEAVGGLDWRDGAAKVVFLIADAPPHMDYAGDTPYPDTLRVAAAKGIRIHTVAASGIDAAGTLVFRQIAQFTRGKFVFLQYGVPASGEDAKRHGVAGAVKNDNLEDVLFEQIRDEVAHFGR